MEILNREQIIEAVDNVKNGTIARVTYRTELPVKAAFKKQGYKVIKVVETSGRLGVNYHNIATVIARKAEQEMTESVQRANNYEWVIRNKVKHNTATNKDYLVLASFNQGHHTRSKYIVSYMGEETTYSSAVDTVKDLVINSYWTPGKTAGEVRNISFENILCINNVGQRVSF